LFERISPDDPNYELLKCSDLKAWADSFNLVAKGHAGAVSITNFIDASLKTVKDAVDVEVGFQDNTPLSERCREIERLCESSIEIITRALTAQADRLGADAVSEAVLQFSAVVREFSATAKRRVLEREMTKSEAVREPDTHASSANGLPEVLTETGEEAASELQEGRAVARNTWLDQQLLQHADWTSDKDIEGSGGPTYNTIKRYRTGAPSTRDRYVRRLLAKACGCNISAVPE
jgi:hypothetical protein